MSPAVTRTTMRWRKPGWDCCPAAQERDRASLLRDDRSAPRADSRVSPRRPGCACATCAAPRRASATPSGRSRRSSNVMAARGKSSSKPRSMPRSPRRPVRWRQQLDGRRVRSGSLGDQDKPLVSHLQPGGGAVHFCGNRPGFLAAQLNRCPWSHRAKLEARSMRASSPSMRAFSLQMLGDTGFAGWA